MKKTLFTVATLAALSTLTLNAANLNASFADTTTWNGNTVPKTEVCSNFNTKPGSTPSIVLKNIPNGANSIVLTFSDETFSGMKNGGHGVIEYFLGKGTDSVIIPTVQGETFNLPEKFSSKIAHRGVKYKKTPGAYLAPCSGGKGNTYSVLIEAVDMNSQTLEKTTLTLGKF